MLEAEQAANNAIDDPQNLTLNAVLKMANNSFDEVLKTENKQVESQDTLKSNEVKQPQKPKKENDSQNEVDR
jgi:hypothetical protein